MSVPYTPAFSSSLGVSVLAGGAIASNRERGVNGGRGDVMSSQCLALMLR